MGLFEKLFGWKKYYDYKFDEFLKILKEGFSLRDQRLAKLERRSPVIQQLTQRVSISQEEFNKMMLEALNTPKIQEKITPKLPEPVEMGPIEEPEPFIEEVKEKLKPIKEEHIEPKLEQTITVSTDSRPHITPLPTIKEIEYRTDLPKKLKPVVYLLFNSDYPMTAKDMLAHLPNISLPTLRTYLHELQKSVVPTQVKRRADREKEYSLSPKTKAEILTFFRSIE